ncbi:MAG TPA: hypothetical protein VF121_01520 [Thermoanaerobaculia bacterium]|nr:hypothetical protein [Thermoanaerobaculia bacterium]
MNAKALAGGLCVAACLVSANAAAWNTANDRYTEEAGNSHLYIVNRALDLIVTLGTRPVAQAALAKMRRDETCKNRWMEGLNRADTSSSYVDNGSPNGAEGTHFWNSNHPKGWPYDNHFNARSANRYHHDNAREQADKYIGVWRENGDCFWLGLALHYVTDLSQPMHVINVIGDAHARIEKEISERYHFPWKDTSRFATGTTLWGFKIWPPQRYDTASWALVQVTRDVYNEKTGANPYGLSWLGDRYFPLSITLARAREALEDAQPWAARYIYGLFNTNFAVGSFYRSDSRYTKDLPGQAAGWDWAPGQYKATCPLGQPMTGISKSVWSDYAEYNAYMARNVQCRNDWPGKFQPTSCYVKETGPGDHQAATMKPAEDWAPNEWKTTCEKDEYVFGVSQTPAGELAKIVCCKASGLNASVANARSLVIESGSGAEPGSESTLDHDWSPGDWRGECGPDRYIIGLSRGWRGVVSRVLCVN